jgi:hypothetical protein
MAHLGGLAQLVERLLCKQDVSGSSPLTSTRALALSGIDESFSTLFIALIKRGRESAGIDSSKHLENCI